MNRQTSEQLYQQGVNWIAVNDNAGEAWVKFISYEPALGPLDDLNIDGIDWLIYGGESGGKRRPENKDWARTMLAKCREVGAAFWHKQSSAFRAGQGVELDGVVYHEFPETGEEVSAL